MDNFTPLDGEEDLGRDEYGTRKEKEMLKNVRTCSVSEENERNKERDAKGEWNGILD